MGSDDLQVQNLRVSVGERDLVSDLSFTLAPHRIAAVVAPSGAGKTTLLRAIAGLHRAEGRVMLGDATAGPDFRRRVVYVAQKPAMLDTSVRDNLARPFVYRSSSGAFDEPAATALLTELGVEGAMHQDARSLSVGEMQRVALVRALLLDPNVLLLDEPTSALDEANAAKVEALLRDRVKNTELAILIVTHDPEQVERLAHETISF